MFPSVFIHSFAYSSTVLLTPGTCCVVPGTGCTTVSTGVAAWLAGEAEAAGRGDPQSGGMTPPHQCREGEGRKED